MKSSTRNVLITVVTIILIAACIVCCVIFFEPSKKDVVKAQAPPEAKSQPKTLPKAQTQSSGDLIEAQRKPASRLLSPPGSQTITNAGSTEIAQNSNEPVECIRDKNGFFPVDAPDEIVMPTDELKKDTILFWIEHSVNDIMGKNIVCYEAKKKKSRKFNDVDGYWLSIDPSSVKKKQKQPMNFLEEMAYGWNVSNPSTDCYELSLKAMPDIKLKIITVSGKPHAVAEINGYECYVKKIYVKANKRFGLMTWEYGEVTGIQIDDNERIQKAKKIKE